MALNQSSPFQNYYEPFAEGPDQAAEQEERNSRIFAIQNACTLHNGQGTPAEYIIAEADRLYRYIMSGAPEKSPVDLRPVKQED